MDRLDPSQRETVSKMSTQYLLVKLAHMGYTEVELADKQRSDLLAMYAHAIADGKDKKPSGADIAAASATTQTDTEIARLRLELETKRFEALQQQRAEERQRRQAKEQAAPSVN